MNNEIESILNELEKVIVGKRAVIEKILTAMLAGGHILLDDVPGVGKTTLAVAMGKALGLNYRRIQFTPDVLPSDIVGFSMYDRQTGGFRYVPGVLADCNLLLGDEINRTSSKTQSALLEAMEEGRTTVDGKTYELCRPFCVIATQNRIGTAGTQPLPHAQLDRFLVCLTIGYPDHESQMNIIRDRQISDPLDSVRQIIGREELLCMTEQVRQVAMSDDIVSYIVRLASASRESELLSLGISPRGALSVARLAKSTAFCRGRDYVIVEDVRDIFVDASAHRVIPSQKARLEKLTAKDAVSRLLAEVRVPNCLS